MCVRGGGCWLYTKVLLQRNGAWVFQHSGSLVYSNLYFMKSWKTEVDGSTQKKWLGDKSTQYLDFMCFWVIAWYINMHIYYVSIKLQIKKYTIRELYRDEVRKKCYHPKLGNWPVHRFTQKDQEVKQRLQIHGNLSPDIPPLALCNLPSPALLWTLQAKLRSSHRKDLHSFLNFSVTLSNANQLLPPK